MCRLTSNTPNSFCEYYYRQMPPATSLPIHCACFVLVLLADTSNHRPRTGREALIFCWSLLVTTNRGRIQQCSTLERTSRNVDIDRVTFARLYPYLPYQIELSIDIVAGLRLKRGAHRHVGGSNRTIISQAQQLMINPRTKLADATIGTFVTLDKIYELLYVGNLLPVEMTREVDSVADRFPNNPLIQRVAKAVALQVVSLRVEEIYGTSRLSDMLLVHDLNA